MKTKHLAKYLLLNVLGLSAFAQGTAFTYQGRLNDGANPANGIYDLRFAIYDSLTSGAQQGSVVTNASTAVSNGLFTATLNFGSQFPGAPRWLEIALRTNGAAGFFTLSPRQPLTPAPYAITAGNVISGGLTAGTYGNAVTFNNANNSFAGAFSGNGANVTNVNAATLNGLNATNFWQLGGNNLTTGKFIGSTNNQPVEIWVNNARALRLEPSYQDSIHTNNVNSVGGSPFNAIAAGVFGSVIAGGGGLVIFGKAYSNSVAADLCFLGSGYNNSIQTNAFESFLGTGHNNIIQSSAFNSFLGGGANNTIGTNDWYSFLGGGSANYLQSNTLSCFLGGGDDNFIQSEAWNSFLGGGWSNSILLGAEGSFLGCGEFNTIQANAWDASICGGRYNMASAKYATVPGGYQNVAGGLASLAAGANAQALHSGTFVWADESVTNAFSSTASNQFLIRAQGGVGINKSNPAGALDVAVASGQSLVFRQDSGLVPGINVATTGGNAGIMRLRNAMEIWPSDDATRAGRLDVRNTAGNATISLDGSSGVVTCVSLNQTSDRNQKENFSQVSPAEILAKVSQLPLSEWSYQTDANTRHIGPMAQDFYSAFNVGTDDKHIAPIDEGGVALAAIQGLNEKVESGKQRAESQIEALKTENAELKLRLEALEKIILNQKSN